MDQRVLKIVAMMKETGLRPTPARVTEALAAQGIVRSRSAVRIRMTRIGLSTSSR